VSNEKYFSSLNYSLANEDTRLELHIVENHACKNLAIVGGSGSRAFPLAAAQSVETLAVLDVSNEQIHLCALRLAAIKNLELEDFLTIMGYPPQDPDTDYLLRRKLATALATSQEQKDWLDFFGSQERWQGIAYWGNWEKSFLKLSKLVRFFMGKLCDGIMDCESLDAQRIFYREKFRKRWKFMVFILGNRAVFNALLYSGNFVKKNIKSTYVGHYMSAFDHLFEHGLARENFFLQLCLLGRIRYSEGLPIEAEPQAFQRMKNNLSNVECTLHRQSIFDYLRPLENSVDFVSLSDVPSYLEAPLAETFLQAIRPSLKCGGVVVVRYYLRIPNRLSTESYTDITARYSDEISNEKLQVYNIRVYEKIR
jgi:S-adenosylmethionine-diacylglycerol 3-amino-3-carboxypropyl transferase